MVMYSESQAEDPVKLLHRFLSNNMSYTLRADSRSCKESNVVVVVVFIELHDLHLCYTRCGGI